MNLIALDTTLPSTCCRRLGSPSIGGRPSGTRATSESAWRARPGAASRDGRFDETLHAKRGALDIELARDDSRDVEDVLDELRLQLAVAGDDVDGVTHPLGRHIARLQHLHPAENRVQRRAQLVRERREEFVLQAARLFGGGEARELRFLAWRDDHAHAGQAHRPAMLVFDAPLAFDPLDRAVGRDDAVLDFVGRAFIDGPPHGASTRSRSSG